MEHRIPYLIENADFPTTGKLFWVPSKDGYMLGWGAGAPTNGTGNPGWAPGAIYIDHTNNKVYINENTAASPTWKRVEAGDVNLGDNEYLYLGGDNDVGLVWTGSEFKVVIPDNTASALDIAEGSNSYIKVVTTDSGETIQIGKPPTLALGAATAAVAMRFGASVTEGLEIKVIDETVSTESAVASIDLTEDVPSGAVILSAQANLETAVTTTTATKIGLGISTDPDKYGLTSGLTKNLKIDTVPDWAVLGSAEDVQVYACDNTGAADGTIDSGSIRVRIVYAVCNSLDDAA